MKLLCTHLRASMLPSTLNILMQICLCGDSLNDDAFEKVVDENDSGSQTKMQNFSLKKINQRINAMLQSYT